MDENPKQNKNRLYPFKWSERPRHSKVMSIGAVVFLLAIIFFDGPAAARTVLFDCWFLFLLAICVVDVVYLWRHEHQAEAVLAGFITVVMAAVFIFFLVRHLEDWATWWQALQSRPFIEFNV